MSAECSDMNNMFSGEAGALFQGRDVHGDVHFHPQAGRRPDPPRQLMAQVPHYTNHEPAHATLNRVFHRGKGEDGVRVAVVRGAPGSGRSAFAITWGHRHAEDYPDGQLLVLLGAQGDPAEATRAVLGELLRAMGLGVDEIPSSLEGRAGKWRTESRGKRILLFIDDAMAPSLVGQLVPGVCPSAVLAVESGDLSGLRAYVSVHPVDIEPLGDDAARALLAEMITQQMLDAEPSAAAELVRWCEGSAAALNVVGALLADDQRPGAIGRLAAKLSDDRRVLRALSRQRDLSLTVIFDAACERLSPLARRCYQAFGAHPGAGTVAVRMLAEVVGQPVDDVTDACDELRKARLIAEPVTDRYQPVSRLIRVHATAVAQDGALTREFVDRYRRRALAAGETWLPGRPWLREFWPALDRPRGFDQVSAREWLEAERPNLRAAAEAAGELDEPIWACQFGIALWPLHEQGKYGHDLMAVAELGVTAAAGLAEPVGLASVLRTQWGFGARQLGRHDQAAELFAAAVEEAADLGLLPAEATALEALGLLRRDQGRLAEAAELLRGNLEIAEQLAAPRRSALARFHYGTVATPAADGLALLELAERYFGAEPYNLAKIALWRGKRLLDDTRLDEAAQSLNSAATSAAEGGWHLERAQICEALADLALRRSETGMAVAHLNDARDLYQAHGFTASLLAVQERLDRLVE